MRSKMLAPLALLAAQLLVPGRASTEDCRKLTMDFILLEGDALSAEIESHIVEDLAEVGISVNTRLLAKADFNAAMQAGDFNLCFTESWGPPYDPQAFATGWGRPNNEAHYPSMVGLEPPATRDSVLQMVYDVLKTTDLQTRQEDWKAILQEMHRQAISLPMWSRRMPAIWNSRLEGYRVGWTQFDYPMHLIQVNDGSKTVRVAPGAQTGLFSSTGPMDPHSYRPNEFFISNWIYEGLVSYNPNNLDGSPDPALATSWSRADVGDGEEYTFVLRQGVTFHDGAPWNCAAAELNFNHVLQPPLNSLDYHGWYELPKYATAWRCDGENFVVTLTQRYYPFLQELSLIRPLRMLSPNSFINGGSDPVTENSCPTKWGNVSASGVDQVVSCVGIKTDSIDGTGPWIFENKTEVTQGEVTTVTDLWFKKNPNWWGAQGDVEFIHVVHYPEPTDVMNALLDDSLDMVVGGGVLTGNQVRTFQTSHAGRFTTVIGPPLMNQIIVLNAAKAPTDELEVRHVVMHAIEKAQIVDEELGGMAEVADSLFPKDAPYCDVDLTPRWDYDLEKAKLLNCPAAAAGDDGEDDAADLGLILGLCFGIGIPLLLLVGGASFFFGKKHGERLLDENEGHASSGSKQAAAPNSEPAPAVVGGAV